jgi:hypothetical protein
MIFIKRLMIEALVIAFGLVMFISITQAQQTFDITFCGSTTITQTVLESKELTITTFEGKGTVRSNPENKAFDNCSYHLLGVSLLMADKVTSFGYSKYMDSDGDFVVQENFLSLDGKEATWKFLYGTGKWKGIKGSGKTTGVIRPKPIAPGTRQGCLRSTGTFELPKK